MKPILTLITSVCMLTSCSCKQSKKQPADKIFREVADYPEIKDSVLFIRKLREVFSLQIHESPVQKQTEQITAFKRIKLFGSDEDFILIEYDWKVGGMNEVPWRNQLVLTSDGKLVKILSGARFELVDIFPGKNSFLLVTKVSARWNGGHEIYKISSDTLENVYEGYYRSAVQTIAGGDGLFAFRPFELNVEFSDENNDGLNDLVFTGQKLMLGKYTKDSLWYDVENERPFSVDNPAEIIPMRISISLRQSNRAF